MSHDEQPAALAPDTCVDDLIAVPRQLLVTCMIALDRAGKHAEWMKVVDLIHARKAVSP